MEGSLILGIVSLLFCGITLKHYAYHNMSRRTRLGTKYIFQILAQMSENFIFIYLGLSLFTMRELVFKPTIIVITTVPPPPPGDMLTIARNLCCTMVCRLPHLLHHQLPHSPTKPSSRHPNRRRRNPPILPSNAFLGRPQRSRRRSPRSRSR
jgi:sodium/hydrogen exchanger-like protein 6/7